MSDDALAGLLPIDAGPPCLVPEDAFEKSAVVAGRATGRGLREAIKLDEMVPALPFTGRRETQQGLIRSTRNVAILRRLGLTGKFAQVAGWR